MQEAFLAEGRAELARARGRVAPREWSRAAARWEEIGRPYPAAVARWREAEALVAAGRRGEAVIAASAALEGASALGARWLASELTAIGGVAL